MFESAQFYYAGCEAGVLSVVADPSSATRILVVDDDPDIRAILCDRLEADGYAVETAGGGTAALEALQTQTYAGVMLDLCLPDMDGLEVLRRLRRSHATLPVILITANENKAHEAFALNLNPQACLLKPFDFPLLQQTITRWFRQEP